MKILLHSLPLLLAPLHLGPNAHLHPLCTPNLQPNSTCTPDLRPSVRLQPLFPHITKHTGSWQSAKKSESPLVRAAPCGSNNDAEAELKLARLRSVIYSLPLSSGYDQRSKAGAGAGLFSWATQSWTASGAEIHTLVKCGQVRAGWCGQTHRPPVYCLRIQARPGVPVGGAAGAGGALRCGEV